MRDRSVVIVRTVRRFYVYGRGYNSELQANMQIAKHYLRKLERRHIKSFRDAMGDNPFKVWSDDWRAIEKVWSELADAEEIQWNQRMFPYRVIGCRCSHCWACNNRKPSTRPGCWSRRMEWLRQVAREIIDGKRLADGTPMSEVKALPQRCA